MKKTTKKTIKKTAPKKKDVSKKTTNKKNVKKSVTPKKTESPSSLDKKQLADIEKKIRIIVAEILGVPQKKITKKAHFFEDLGMDSMKALEILAALERLFNVEVDEESLQKMTSLENIMNLVAELVAKQNKKKTKNKKKKNK